MLDTLSVGTIPVIAPRLDETNSPAYWRSQAAEARKEAAQMSDIMSRQTMENIAASYDKLAEWAEKRPR